LSSLIPFMKNTRLAPLDSCWITFVRYDADNEQLIIETWFMAGKSTEITKSWTFHFHDFQRNEIQLNRGAACFDLALPVANSASSVMISMAFYDFSCCWTRQTIFFGVNVPRIFAINPVNCLNYLRVS
jgi:hypothetical protein